MDASTKPNKPAEIASSAPERAFAKIERPHLPPFMAPFEPIRIVIFGPAKALELLSAELFDAGAGGLVEEPGAIVVYPSDAEEKELFGRVIATFEENTAALLRDEPLEVAFEAIDPSWQKRWQEALRPVKISRSFTLRPTHCPLEDYPLEDGGNEQTIWFEPAASFGSGDHPTTELAATWLEEHLRARPGASCFDVGTGTGVLALVAARCGASSVIAVDIDDVSVKNARRNCELNDLSEHIVVEKGSANSRSEVFDLVLANINTPILLKLAQDLSARVAPGGKLLLTGLLVEDIPEMKAAFQGGGLTITERDEDRGWALLILSR